MIGKHIRLVQGHYKGLLGEVKDHTRTHVIVCLDAIMRNVRVPREHVRLLCDWTDDPHPIPSETCSELEVLRRTIVQQQSIIQTLRTTIESHEQVIQRQQQQIDSKPIRCCCPTYLICRQKCPEVQRDSWMTDLQKTNQQRTQEAIEQGRKTTQLVSSEEIQAVQRPFHPIDVDRGDRSDQLDNNQPDRHGKKNPKAIRLPKPAPSMPDPTPFEEQERALTSQARRIALTEPQQTQPIKRRGVGSLSHYQSDVPRPPPSSQSPVTSMDILDDLQHHMSQMSLDETPLPVTDVMDELESQMNQLDLNETSDIPSTDNVSELDPEVTPEVIQPIQIPNTLPEIRPQISEAEFLQKTMKELKGYCRERKYKGFSKYTKKADLVDFILSQLQSPSP
jgi:hypothetical protein